MLAELVISDLREGFRAGRAYRRRIWACRIIFALAIWAATDAIDLLLPYDNLLAFSIRLLEGVSPP